MKIDKFYEVEIRNNAIMSIKTHYKKTLNESLNLNTPFDDIKESSYTSYEFGSLDIDKKPGTNFKTLEFEMIERNYYGEMQLLEHGKMPEEQIKEHIIKYCKKNNRNINECQDLLISEKKRIVSNNLNDFFLIKLDEFLETLDLEVILFEAKQKEIFSRYFKLYKTLPDDESNIKESIKIYKNRMNTAITELNENEKYFYTKEKDVRIRKMSKKRKTS